ncbi:hypothetical protein KBD75_02085 [Candidatus Woesebacteria bacterium]|nr:hypothetical protein [Candidatus Woesebacteria bacterium]
MTSIERARGGCLFSTISFLSAIYHGLKIGVDVWFRQEPADPFDLTMFLASIASFIASGSYTGIQVSHVHNDEKK